eukprot:104751-Chlamydomonas_euryale.AAC.2
MHLSPAAALPCRAQMPAKPNSVQTNTPPFPRPPPPHTHTHPHPALPTATYTNRQPHTHRRSSY